MTSLISRLTVAAVLVGGALAPGLAAGDTIHLKNGRVFHAADAYREDGRLHFTLHGSPVAIPLELVERVIENDRVAASTAGQEASAGTSSTAERASSATEVSSATQASHLEQAPAEPRGADGSGSGLEALQGLAGLRGGAALPDQGQLQQLGTDLLIPLAAQLGAFAEAGGSGPGAADGSGEPDAAELAAIAPLVQRLGQLLASPDPSPEETAATVKQLLDQLDRLGVTDEMIRERAASLGIPLDELRRRER